MLLERNAFDSIAFFSQCTRYEKKLSYKIIFYIKVVDSRKLDLKQKKIILLSRIAILLLKCYFGREKIEFHEKNLNYTKNFKNYEILIIYKSLFQEKDSLQLNHFQFSKMNKLLSNSAICL